MTNEQKANLLTSLIRHITTFPHDDLSDTQIGPDRAPYNVYDVYENMVVTHMQVTNHNPDNYDDEQFDDYVRNLLGILPDQPIFAD